MVNRIVNNIFWLFRNVPTINESFTNTSIKKYYFPVNLCSSAEDLRVTVRRKEIFASGNRSNKCIKCEGQIELNYESFSFGTLELVGNKVQLMCHCSPSRKSIHDTHTLMLRRSSSAENLPLIFSRRKASILTDALDLKFD